MNFDRTQLDGSRYDVVVVGGGVMGSATAFSLSRRASSSSSSSSSCGGVLLLEQYYFGHRRGSSHGSSRIIRKSYHEDYYCKMMHRSFELWDQVEDLAKTKVITKTGGLDFVKRGTEVERKLKESMAKAGVAFEEIEDVGVLETTFPGFSMPEGYTCLHSADAGVVNASKACEVLQCLARKHGAHLVDQVKVLSVDEDPATRALVLETSAGKIMADKLVLTAGAWNQRLVKSNFQLDLLMKPINTTVVYWKCEEEKDSAAYVRSPVFIVYQDDDRVLNAYGTPALEYPGLLKFCLHSGPACDPETRLCIPNLKDIELHLKDLTRAFLPKVDASQHVSAEACMYTNTRDENFILDCLPSNKNIVVGAGFSGHGFKFAPLIGDILADLATGKTAEFPLKPFSIHRFL